MDNRPPASAVGIRLSAMMFLEFFVWGAWYVSVGNYMDSHGMKAGIAWAYTVGPIAAVLSPFFLGMIADRFFATERVLGMMHLLGGVVMLAAPAVAKQQQAGEYWPFVGMLALHMLCYMPTLGLTNTLAFHHVANAQKQFPLIRVFGTIGWIAANWVVSKGFHADTSEQQFYITGAAAIVLGLFSFTLPHTPPPGAGKPFSARDALGLDALALLADRSFLIFMLGSFLICIPLAAYYSFAPVFAGAIFKDTAFYMSFGQVSEIFFMLVMPLCFARLGVKWMLAVGMFAWVARYGLFAAAADQRVTWMVIGGILLHGVCYDFFFVTGQIYVDQKAPSRIRGQAQGLLVLVTQGLGLGVGAQVAGAIVKKYTQGEGLAAIVDWKMVWVMPTAMAAVILLVFVALFKDRGDRSAPSPT